jgi:hypothetical protein
MHYFNTDPSYPELNAVKHGQLREQTTDTVLAKSTDIHRRALCLLGLDLAEA